MTKIEKMFFIGGIDEDNELDYGPFWIVNANNENEALNKVENFIEKEPDEHFKKVNLEYFHKYKNKNNIFLLSDGLYYGCIG